MTKYRFSVCVPSPDFPLGVVVPKESIVLSSASTSLSPQNNLKRVAPMVSLHNPKKMRPTPPTTDFPNKVLATKSQKITIINERRTARRYTPYISSPLSERSQSRKELAEDISPQYTKEIPEIFLGNANFSRDPKTRKNTGVRFVLGLFKFAHNKANAPAYNSAEDCGLQNVMQRKGIKIEYKQKETVPFESSKQKNTLAPAEHLINGAVKSSQCRISRSDEENKDLNSELAAYRKDLKVSNAGQRFEYWIGADKEKLEAKCSEMTMKKDELETQLREKIKNLEQERKEFIHILNDDKMKAKESNLPNSYSRRPMQMNKFGQNIDTLSHHNAPTKELEAKNTRLKDQKKGLEASNYKSVAQTKELEPYNIKLTSANKESEAANA
ncbi:hypothetical protein Glove_71g94 [Diversispora epigaea]|uniref:Uncharacterized protein n=1 Tax=Diversispora epigaea TaxID=1348612 RepID=A0A397JED7_9GLOM|nr:hypothetical protein Glove_71g94 [Diversispora epigaea]